MHGCGVDPDLPSFPTRRSSDLARPGGQFLAFASTPVRQQARPAKGRARFAKGDRKSTRLNSSHTVISYAVFCLKKKIKRNSSFSADSRLTSSVSEMQLGRSPWS